MAGACQTGISFQLCPRADRNNLKPQERMGVIRKILLLY